jgi:hypothetical protein
VAGGDVLTRSGTAHHRVAAGCCHSAKSSQVLFVSEIGKVMVIVVGWET